MFLLFILFVVQVFNILMNFISIVTILLLVFHTLLLLLLMLSGILSDYILWHCQSIFYNSIQFHMVAFVSRESKKHHFFSQHSYHSLVFLFSSECFFTIIYFSIVILFLYFSVSPSLIQHSSFQFILIFCSASFQSTFLDICVHSIACFSFNIFISHSALFYYYQVS